jgi:uncharacterized protein (DUF1330 family)
MQTRKILITAASLSVLLFILVISLNFSNANPKSFYKSTQMSTYVIFIKEKTIDLSELSIYASLTDKAVGDHPAELLAAYGELEVPEGDKPEGVVIVKFPSMEAAKKWYNSPLYKQATQHRMKGAKWNVLFVEGI